MPTSKRKKAKPTAHTKSKTKRAVATKKRAPITGVGWHTWSARPSERAVRDHVEAFFQAVHEGDMKRAFTLCPIYTYRTPLIVGADNVAAVRGAVRNMKETLSGYDYVAEGDEAWYRHVTPPSRVDFAQLNLAMPDDDGDTLANVFVDDEVTDATCIFALRTQGKSWVLAFKLFKVM